MRQEQEQGYECKYFFHDVYNGSAIKPNTLLSETFCFIPKVRYDQQGESISYLQN